MSPTVQTQDAEASMLTKNIQMNTKIIFKLKITKREDQTMRKKTAMTKKRRRKRRKKTRRKAARRN